MIIIKKTSDLIKWLDAQRKKGIHIGFVPTMGALHLGHISLINSSKEKNNITITSIFVNPKQFNDPKDFEKYPVTIENDICKLEKAGCDLLFLPSVSEMYPDDINPKLKYELGYLETILEGKYRPGHFQGVCMIVHRLLNCVNPDRLYLGQKDYQQCMVIKKLLDQIELKTKVETIICPTLREPDGLAMSSRNMRLNANDRKKSTTIYQTLSIIKENYRKTSPAQLKTRVKVMLEQADFKVDYVEIADASDLSVVEEWNGQQKTIALIAATLNEVRLIDNMLLS
jgi:pantoate--beta-alanine ligase